MIKLFKLITLCTGGPVDRQVGEEEIGRFVQQAQEQRQEYVSELFKEKGRLTRELESFKPEVKEAAYKHLASIIEKHSKIISRAEKQRLLRERLMHQGNQAEYNKRLRAAKRVSADTDDNLIKMALVLIKVAKKEELLTYVHDEDVAGGMADVEEGAIETRVSRAEAENLLKAWKRILV